MGAIENIVNAYKTKKDIELPFSKGVPDDFNLKDLSHYVPTEAMSKIRQSMDRGEDITLPFGSKPTEKAQTELRTSLGETATMAPETKKTLQEFALKKVPSSAIELGKGLITPVLHPVETALSIGHLSRGIVQKVLGYTPETTLEKKDEMTVNALADYFKNRYGSLEKIKETAYNDPAGFTFDLSTILYGGAGTLAKVGKIAKIPTFLKGAEVVGKTAEMISPVAQALKVGGGALQLTGKAVKGVAAPFRKAVLPEVIKSAQELGIELPASAVSKSVIVKQAEALAAKGFGGQKIIDRVEKAGQDIKNIANETIIKTGATTDIKLIGNEISNSLDKAKSIWIETKNKLYEEATIPSTKIRPAIPSEVPGIPVALAKRVPFTVDTMNTVNLLDDIIATQKSAGKILGVEPSGMSFFTNLRKTLSQKNVVAKDVSNAIKELNERMGNFNDPIVTGNAAKLRKVVATLSDDLDNTIKLKRPDLAEAIDRANDYYIKGLNELNSEWGTKIKQLADKGQFSEIPKAILSPSTALEDIPKIYTMIGAENVKSVQSILLKDIFEGATSKLTGKFTATGIETQIKKFGIEKLKTMLTPEQVNIIEKLNNVVKGLEKSQSITKGSQTAFLNRISAEVGGLLTVIGYQKNPLPILAVIGSDAALSKFIASATGQKYLTTGIPAGLKIGEVIEKVGKTVSTIPSQFRTSLLK